HASYDWVLLLSALLSFFFFFQAEDGIRDFHVTGVQTCALPICDQAAVVGAVPDHLVSRLEARCRELAIEPPSRDRVDRIVRAAIDRKSTRLNSSHVKISYAVFCLKKKKDTINNTKESQYNMITT